MASGWRAAAVLHYLIPLAIGQYTPLPRWGQAVALLENLLYVHGGLTDQYDQYSYTSAPPTSELLLLDLSVSFSATSTPWQLLSNTTTTSNSPALGWHTLSAFNSSSFLLFGGQPGPNSQIVLTSLNDSATLVSAYDRTNPSFSIEPQNWAGEPMRRIRHSASSTGGKVWIVGGEKADGSGNAFSDHRLFNPVLQEFVVLPSGGNTPPDLYGHTSLILPDGRLLVFGGYCASCGKLIPLNTIWSLDTTQATLAWDVISVSNSTLPSSRLDFAAVVLATGEILIHGGGDSELQTTYSDGWILNTDQNPMVWQEAQALQQLGPRKDHLAIQCNGQVLFAFGYGSTAPASATMQIYNPSSSSMVSSYNPPPAGSTPAIISLPAPSQTGDSGSSGGSAGAPSVVYPTSTAGAGSSSSNNNTTAIAVGTTFGIIGLIAGGLAVVWYIKRSRGRESSRNGRFLLLGGDHDHEYDSTDGGPANFLDMDSEIESHRCRGFLGARALPLAAALAHLGLSKHGSPLPPRPRRDMFADEDTRQFGWGGPPDMLRREGSGGTSLWSMRSMSAMVRGMISREPSARNSGRDWDEWEKIEGDHESVIHEGNNSRNVMPNSGHPHERDGSLRSYVDPFSDPLPHDEEYNLYRSNHGALKLDGEHDNIDVDARSLDPSPLCPPRTPLPLSTPIPTLSPLREVASDSADTLASRTGSSQNNSSSKGDSSGNTYPSQPSFISQSAYSPVTPPTLYSSTPIIALSHRHSSILDSHPPSFNPIRRSDSWWARFMKTSLLDRRNSTGQKPLDLRDPNPAPRLMSINESNASPDSLESRHELAVQNIRLSSPSVHSGWTANTEVAERLCGSYDVVQRIASDGSTSRRTASIGSISANEHGILSGLSSDQTKLTSFLPISPSSNPSSFSNEPSRTGPTTHGSPFTRAAAHAVTSRVQEIERQMTNNLEAERYPPPRNTRKREEVPSRTRPSIQYGLAPRASLYVANPDSGVPTL
ncbi:hypothetical protein DEU56DRAFT_976795 [Suillus clintonianus]|uniref:uncharacterized protein n=1 Tax=Suillus clintonianus TaxID=1904413 RepID=UPI001B8798A0|nr:uncharacterized protein DEU56DRAFT_976795 [Suillus clintonianus]KAG2154038.1 hypothetical protein DEU56DRAFT_976795 [Suillus clintonianus]